MSRRCDSKGFVIKAEQMGKLKNEDVIYVNVMDALESCAKIDARTINTSGLVGFSTDSGAAAYNAANVPEDVFGCSKNKCYNTGTFQGPIIAATGEEDTQVIIGDFKKTMDGNLYLAGIVTAYVFLPDGDHQVSLEIANYTEQAWDNASTTTVTVHATKGGDGSYLYPVVFDLTQVASSTGTGWTNGSVGTKIRVKVDRTNLKEGDLVGVSSFAFYESHEDLEIAKTILLTCADTFGDNQSFDVIESACNSSEYDPQSGTMTASVTANKWSKNFEYINPTFHTTEETEFGVPHIVTRKVVEGTGELAGYGVIQLSDMIEGDCGFLYIQTPGCANNSYELTRISSPVPVKFATADANKFQVLTSDYNGDESLGQILVHPQWIGQELNVIYRQSHTAEIYEITNEFREFNVRILAPFRKKDGTIEWHLYENAFMTSDANNISRSDESSKEVQFTIAADENGVRKKIARPLD